MADVGVWKLLIIPLVIIFILGFILNAVLAPFLDAGIYPTDVNESTVNTLSNITKNGVGIDVDIPILGTWSPNVPSPISLLPEFMQDFIVNQILILSTIPVFILIPMVILFSVAIIYAVVHIIQGFIP